MMSKDYLQEGYGGEPQNPLTDKCFFCYTIHDTEFNKYYSGVKTRENSGEHGLLETYFTSSTVVDFKSRLKDTPEVFGVRIEYFTNRSDAFDAEKRFHAAHDVGKNKAFYNACAAGGSNCGAGSVLCIKDDGSTYRVSTEKYRKGEDRSVSAGRMNVYILPDITTLRKIPISEYDAKLHVKELEGTTTVLDNVDGKCKRVPTVEYLENKARYSGVTRGFVHAYRIGGTELEKTPVEVYRENQSMYVVPQLGMVSVIDRLTGEYVYISKQDYRSNKGKYQHPNHGMVAVFDTVTGANVRISKEEYKSAYPRYLNHAVKGDYSCVDIRTGASVKVTKKEFLENPDRFRGHTIGTTKAFDIISKLVLTLTTRAFKESPAWVVAVNTKEVFRLHEKVFTKKIDLGFYLRKNFGKTILETRVLLKDMASLTRFLQVNNGAVMSLDSVKSINFKEEDFYVKRN